MDVNGFSSDEFSSNEPLRKRLRLSLYSGRTSKKSSDEDPLKPCMSSDVSSDILLTRPKRLDVSLFKAESTDSSSKTTLSNSCKLSTCSISSGPEILVRDRRRLKKLRSHSKGKYRRSEVFCQNDLHSTDALSSDSLLSVSGKYLPSQENNFSVCTTSSLSTVPNLSDDYSSNGPLSGADGEISTESSDEFHLCVTDCDTTLWSELRHSVLQTKMTNTQINGILAVLKKFKVGPLPKDARTLKVGRKLTDIEIKNKSGMEYYFFGYRNQILATLSRYDEDTLNAVDNLIIKDNVDGIPLYKSSETSMWPLLAKIDNLKPSVVFPVLITIGNGKPIDLHFLDDAITEMNELLSSGIVYGGKTFSVTFLAHICDTPARNMVKATKSFNSYHGCDFCVEKGYYDGKRMIWLRTENLTKRTDSSFRSREQPEHHKVHKSPYEGTECDMIMNFPVDFMHQGCGVMLKIMNWNILSPLANLDRRRCRMSAANIVTLNSRLLSLRPFIPNCFARKPRSTKDLPRFKSTELRQILLYTSCVIFKGLMSSDKHYDHICHLYVACRLMVDPCTARSEALIAEQLLEKFCRGAKSLYGNSFMVYNVHALLHLPAIALKFGSLDSVSAYPFESYLGELKRLVKSPRRPIVSVVNRVYELQTANKSDKLRRTKPIIYTTSPNNFYVDLSRKKCYECVELRSDKAVMREYVASPFFRNPISSEKVGCFKICNNHYKYVHLEKRQVLMMRRAMRIDLSRMPGFRFKGESVFVAMLHDNIDGYYQ